MLLTLGQRLTRVEKALDLFRQVDFYRNKLALLVAEIDNINADLEASVVHAEVTAETTTTPTVLVIPDDGEVEDEETVAEETPVESAEDDTDDTEPPVSAG